MAIKKSHYRRLGALRYVCGLKISPTAKFDMLGYPKCKRCQALIILKAKRLDRRRES